MPTQSEENMLEIFTGILNGKNPDQIAAAMGFETAAVTAYAASFIERLDAAVDRGLSDLESIAKFVGVSPLTLAITQRELRAAKEKGIIISLENIGERPKLEERTRTAAAETHGAATVETEEIAQAAPEPTRTNSGRIEQLRLKKKKSPEEFREIVSYALEDGVDSYKRLAKYIGSSSPGATQLRIRELGISIPWKGKHTYHETSKAGATHERSTNGLDEKVTGAEAPHAAAQSAAEKAKSLAERAHDILYKDGERVKYFKGERRNQLAQFLREAIASGEIETSSQAEVALGFTYQQMYSMRSEYDIQFPKHPKQFITKSRQWTPPTTGKQADDIRAIQAAKAKGKESYREISEETGLGELYVRTLQGKLDKAAKREGQLERTVDKAVAEQAAPKKNSSAPVAQPPIIAVWIKTYHRVMRGNGAHSDAYLELLFGAHRNNGGTQTSKQLSAMVASGPEQVYQALRAANLEPAGSLKETIVAYGQKPLDTRAALKATANMQLSNDDLARFLEVSTETVENLTTRQGIRRKYNRPDIATIQHDPLTWWMVSRILQAKDAELDDEGILKLHPGTNALMLEFVAKRAIEFRHKLTADVSALYGNARDHRLPYVTDTLIRSLIR